MAKSNANLHRAKREKNDEFFKELRESTEGWVPIKGFEDYEINENGEVFLKGGYYNGRRRRSKFIKKVLLKIGYYVVSLNRKKCFLHRLLAEAFIPNPDKKKEVDHIDGNPQNNTISNLRWCTHKENLNNPISVERERKSHIGLVSNIKGRRKIWIDKENKIYKMIL